MTASSPCAARPLRGRWGPTAAASTASDPGRPAELVFASVRDHDALELFSMREDGTRLRRLTRRLPEPSDPDWSPDSSRIVFEAVLLHTEGETALWVVDADGRHARRLVAYGRDPAWSPDGEGIAFVRTRDGNEDISVVGVDGRDQSRVTANPGADIDLDWRP